MTSEGQTVRLLLIPLALEDAAQIQEVFPHWEIVRYLRNTVPWPYPPDGARYYIEEVALPAIARGEEWHWTLRLKSAPDRLIGYIALANAEGHNRGFWLAPPWQGQGLMSEAAAWSNDFWFDVLGFPVLCVPKAAQNLASRRISEKHGMRIVCTGEQDYVCGRLPSETWEITAEEWRAWKAAQPRTEGASLL